MSYLHVSRLTQPDDTNNFDVYLTFSINEENTNFPVRTTGYIRELFRGGWGLQMVGKQSSLDCILRVKKKMGTSNKTERPAI